MPQDSTQLNWLIFESGLELFDYPLDIKLEEGDEYVDPTIPEGEPGWLYTTVKPDFTFPDDLAYELIEECYIPSDEEMIEIEPLTRGAEPVRVNVERAAFEKVGYQLEPEPQTRHVANIKPRGKIRVKDNSTVPETWVGVKRVKIRCHVIVKWSTAWTEEDGSYVMGSNFLINPHYAIVFENREGFTIWGNYAFLAAANYGMGWHSHEGYNKDIDTYYKSWDWAVVNNAAYEYYRMCKTEGIAMPPSNLKIAVFRDLEASCAPMLRRIPIGGIISESGFASFMSFAFGPAAGLAVILDAILWWMKPDLFITTLSGKYELIYGTVNHELSHASHFSRVGKNYWSKYIGEIVDSTILLGDFYGNGSHQYSGYSAVGEMWGYAMGYLQRYGKYNTSRLSSPYQGDVVYRDLPRAGINDWIKPDPIWALITRGVLTKKQVFDCLTADVTTVAALEAKMCEKYPDEADMIRFAFANDDTLMAEITGSDVIETLSNVSYSTQMQANTISVTFDIPNAVRGTDYSVVSDVTNSGTRIWTIRFLKQGSYTIIANYQLDGNKNFSSGKEVYAFSSPDISVDKTAVIINETVKFTANNPADGFQYIWKVNGVEGGPVGRPNPGASRTLSTTVTEPIDVSCQAYLDGEPFGDPSQTISVTMPLGNAIPPIPEFSSHKTVASAGSTVKFKVKNYNPFWTGLTFEWHKGTDGGFGAYTTHVETSGEFSTTIDGQTTEIWCVVRLDGREIRRTPAVTVQSTQLPDYDVLLQDRWLKEKGEPWFVRSQLFIELDPDQRYLKDSNILSRYFIGTTWALTGHSTNHYYIPEDCLDMVTELIGRNADYDWGYDFPGGFGSPRSFLTSQVAPPTPVITADKTEAAMGESVTFTVNNHVPGATYKWFRYSYAMTFVEKPEEIGPSFTTELDFPTIKAYCVAYLNGLPSEEQGNTVVVDWNHQYAPDLLRMSDAERGQWMMNRTALR